MGKTSRPNRLTMEGMVHDVSRMSKDNATNHGRTVVVTIILLAYSHRKASFLFPVIYCLFYSVVFVFLLSSSISLITLTDYTTLSFIYT